MFPEFRAYDGFPSLPGYGVGPPMFIYLEQQDTHLLTGDEFVPMLILGGTGFVPVQGMPIPTVEFNGQPMGGNPNVKLIWRNGRVVVRFEGHA
jgi:hypothetical protein